jgi:hypothetical protein
MLNSTHLQAQVQSMHQHDLALELQLRAHTPQDLCHSLASSLPAGTALSDDVFQWLQVRTPDLRGLSWRERTRLDGLVTAYATKDNSLGVADHARELAILASRLQERQWTLPTDFVPDPIRTQGDCFPDSIAYLERCSQEGVVGVPVVQWSHEERSKRFGAVAPR